MSWQNILQFIALAALLAVTVPPLGRYIAAVYGARDDGSAPGDRVFNPIERTIYRVLGVDHRREQRWNVYAVSLVAFSMVSILVLYVILRMQGSLPFNPTDREGLPPTGAFNTAISFVTNTNWQWYSGEVSISHFTQMVDLAVQNFVSAAAGLSIVIALIRGITRSGARNLGNFWVDITRSLLRVLLPLSIVAAVVLMSQGVVQNLNGHTAATTIDTSSQVVVFVHFGAEEKILYEAHPHIGTNKLPHIITVMRQTIVDCGGQFLFNKKVVDFIIDKGDLKIAITSDGEKFSSNAVILATGHSARDIFELLHQKNILIESKPFALGVRVEHPQHLIDSVQYHCSSRGEYLPPASYSLVQQVNGRGVFSFCMCPGGIIAPAATAPGEIVVNGWSPSKRNNPYANSGMVVSVDEKDAWGEFKKLKGFKGLESLEGYRPEGNSGVEQLRQAELFHQDFVLKFSLACSSPFTCLGRGF